MRSLPNYVISQSHTFCEFTSLQKYIFVWLVLKTEKSKIFVKLETETCAPTYPSAKLCLSHVVLSFSYTASFRANQRKTVLQLLYTKHMVNNCEGDTFKQQNIIIIIVNPYLRDAIINNFILSIGWFEYSRHKTVIRIYVFLLDLHQ